MRKLSVDIRHEAREAKFFRKDNKWNQYIKRGDNYDK
jgi:hypothetical protein